MAEPIQDQIKRALEVADSAGGRLFYAEREHPEYREYDSVNALIVSTDGTTTVNGVPIDSTTSPLY
ncbi:MAG: hypothetical protein OXI58_07840 [Gemmatimonadota bacterium]|nr:hypothetical protein [Gemmatimonadota bacterium]